jgi:hypothetical protein
MFEEKRLLMEYQRRFKIYAAALHVNKVIQKLQNIFLARREKNRLLHLRITSAKKVQKNLMLMMK